MQQSPVTSPKVLIVEDDFLIGLEIADALGGAGFATQSAASVEEARDLVDRVHFDTVVLDFRVRDEVCVDLAHELAHKGIPFVFCTGSVVDEVHEMFPDTAVVAKPFSDKDLVRAVTLLAA